MIEEIFGGIPFGIPIGAKLKRKIHELLVVHFD
jgi:hypothetical protein